MMLDRFLRWRRGEVVGWDDQPGDTLPDLVASLAALDTPEIAAGVERSRQRILDAYRAGVREQVPSASSVIPSRRPYTTRRWAYALVAAALLVGLAGGAVVASGPGEPLYPYRVAWEGLLLPTDGEARITAQLDRMDRRLDEAERAASEGDRQAVGGALRAYAGIATSIDIDGLGDEARLAHQVRIAAQERRLERLAIADPMDGPAALQAARRLRARLGPEGTDPTSPGPAGPSSEPTTAPSPSPTRTPNGSPSPAMTPGWPSHGPDRSSEPRSTDRPDGTPSPDPTGGSTARPGSGPAGSAEPVPRPTGVGPGRTQGPAGPGGG